MLVWSSSRAHQEFFCPDICTIKTTKKRITFSFQDVVLYHTQMTTVKHVTSHTLWVSSYRKLNLNKLTWKGNLLILIGEKTNLTGSTNSKMSRVPRSSSLISAVLCCTWHVAEPLQAHVAITVTLRLGTEEIETFSQWSSWRPQISVLLILNKSSTHQ